MDDLIEFLRARFDEDALWATEASRWNDGPAIEGGAHWQWVDPETDEVIGINPGLDEFVNGDRFRVSLRSREERQREAGQFALPQFAIGETEEVRTAVGAHIARHDPARVLVEVEATRELLRVAAAAADFAPTFTTGVAAKLEDVLRLFALPYTDHPDYRPEWAPEGSST